MAQPGSDEKEKIRTGHKTHFIKLKTGVRVILQGYRDEREEELLIVKSFLEKKVATISKLNVDILERSGDENEIAQEIVNSEGLQSNIH